MRSWRVSATKGLFTHVLLAFLASFTTFILQATRYDCKTATHVPYSGNARIAINQPATSDETRVYFVYDDRAFYVFEDWISPFIDSLSAFLKVKELIVSHSENVYKNFPGSFEPGDIVFLVQDTYDLRPEAGVDYWFINTEGTDKQFAEVAISQGFKKIIDYSLHNAGRHKLNGAEVSLWLPIVTAPAVTFHIAREYLCMVGGANTERRQTFLSDLLEAAEERHMNISVHGVLGWSRDGIHRDYHSQACALVVNVASVENNQVAPRLRLDILWLYDVLTISEEVQEPDMSEYNGTLMFATYEHLANKTLQIWNSLTLKKGLPNLQSKAAMRASIQRSRQIQFNRVVRQVLGNRVLLQG